MAALEDLFDESRRKQRRTKAYGRTLRVLLIPNTTANHAIIYTYTVHPRLSEPRLSESSIIRTPKIIIFIRF